MTADLMPELRTVVVVLYFGKELIQLRLVGDHCHRAIDEHSTHNVSKTVLYLVHNELFSVGSIYFIMISFGVSRATKPSTGILSSLASS